MEHDRRPHFVLVPWMAQGHFIPMLDIARLLASRSALVTLVTTPANAARVAPILSRLSVASQTLPFPSAAVGLPDGCESLDAVPSRDMAGDFYRAAKLLRAPLERLLLSLRPLPTCIISGVGFPWLQAVARQLAVPRLVFQGFSAFALLATHNLYDSKPHEKISSPDEPFALPGLPHASIHVTRPQLPKFFDASSKFQDIYREIREGELTSDGLVVNSFEELEPAYAAALAKATGKKVWAIGPVSLSTQDALDVAERGNKASVDEAACMQWLDAQPARSVVYVSFGSMGRLSPTQLAELGAGLAASNRLFVWVVRAGDEPPELEETARKRCLVIHGWAPQVMVLSHRAVGGFVTHCGWNSLLEAVAAGVAVAAWPLGAEQFLNEKLVVEVLGIGVGVGAKAGEEGWVAREAVAKAVERLMDGGEEGEERRRRAGEYGERARRAMREGGSSYVNLTHLIDYVLSCTTEARIHESDDTVAVDQQGIHPHAAVGSS